MSRLTTPTRARTTATSTRAPTASRAARPAGAGSAEARGKRLDDFRQAEVSREPRPQTSANDVAEKACDFLMGVLERMGIPADIDVNESDDKIVLEIQTADPSW
jgi:predicted RNA-binding protein Jag